MRRSGCSRRVIGSGVCDWRVDFGGTAGVYWRTQVQSTRSTWSSSQTSASRQSVSAWPSSRKDVMGGWSTRRRPTVGCCCAERTRCPRVGLPGWSRCSATTTQPTSSARRGASKNSSADCSRPHRWPTRTSPRCWWGTTSRSPKCPRPTGCRTRSASVAPRSKSSSSPPSPTLEPRPPTRPSEILNAPPAGSGTLTTTKHASSY